MKHIVTRSQRLGEAIRCVKDMEQGTPEENFLRFSEGFKLFKGKIGDVLRETRGHSTSERCAWKGLGNTEADRPMWNSRMRT
ncbi:DUF917 domain-containing protein [Blautia sp. RD014234]|nr:DUF917 domain-containing protein [Blautia parvula]